MNDTKEVFSTVCRTCKHVFCKKCEMSRNVEGKGDGGK